MGNTQSHKNDVNPTTIVENFLKNGFTIKPFNNIITPRPPNTVEPNDPSKEYKDMCTDIVVKFFLSTDIIMFNFLKFVYSTFKIAIDKYKEAKNLEQWDIFFVYKGGNVLRIIANDFLAELPNLAAKEIHDYYDKFFKRSDADFSIYINPKISIYDTVFKDMTELSYLLQVYIRDIFMSDLSQYFDFYKYSSEYKTHILDEYKKVLEESNSVKDPDNKIFYGLKPMDITFDHNNFYQTEPDTQIIFNPNNDKETITQNLSSKKYTMKISSNETLDFISGTDNRIKFNLIRTKIMFNISFNDNGRILIKKIGGELIDVSIPHRLDKKLIHFFEHDGVNKYIQKYKLSEKNNEKTLIFYSFTYVYLANDLEYILFEFVKKPWDTPKYEKRLNRLLYFYFIDLFIKFKLMTQRKNVINELVALFSNSDVKKNPDGLVNSLRNFVKLYSVSNLMIVVLLKNIIRIITQELKTPEDYTQYDTMINTILENFKFMNKSFEGVKSFCTADGTLKLDFLYNNDFESLI